MNTSEHGGHVEELYLKENLLEELPTQLHKSLPLLTNMYLHKNNMVRLPEDLGCLQNLTVLDISKNHLREVPESIRDLKVLKTLDLSHNQLTKLDLNIFRISSLEYLVAVGNRINILPESVRNLTNLFGLYLSKNQIISVPDSLANCRNLHELYLDHNLLTNIPSVLTTLPDLSILSLSSNHLVTLPALPFLSCPRVLCEENPHLHHIPYLTGCQQTILSYSNQASWAAMAGPVVQNTLQGVWNMRLLGCSQVQDVPSSSKSAAPVIEINRKSLTLPSELSQVFPPTSPSLPSLSELCLKAAYSLLTGSLRLTVKVNKDIQLHLPSTSLQTEGVHLRDCQLPKSTAAILARGPATFCSWPGCSKPIFQESCVEIIEKSVQRTFLGTGEIEMMSILATRFYCSSGCFTNYSRGSLFPWEREILKRGICWS
eukprot:GFUD01051582.1.p1 GENE.GFUD01051582.1~~GFUD01051582.1.p1  ORF type:complete len:429 (-),score=108.48 GFUD01051582.1:51-1337(-)